MHLSEEDCYKNGYAGTFSIGSWRKNRVAVLVGKVHFYVGRKFDLLGVLRRIYDNSPARYSYGAVGKSLSSIYIKSMVILSHLRSTAFTARHHHTAALSTSLAHGGLGLTAVGQYLFKLLQLVSNFLLSDL